MVTEHNGGHLALTLGGILGDSIGRLLILQLQNFRLGPLIVNPWQHDPYPTDSFVARLHFGCPLYRVWSEVGSSALGVLIPCPHCGGSVKLNPLTINADWRPIAASSKTMTNDD